MENISENTPIYKVFKSYNCITVFCNFFVTQGKYFNYTIVVCFLSLIFSSIPPKRFVIVDYKWNGTLFFRVNIVLQHRIRTSYVV